VVGNAAICTEARNPQPIDQVDEDEFDAHMRINARGIFLGCKYSVQQFLKQEPRANGMRGWIVNFASMVSNMGMQGVSKFLPNQQWLVVCGLHIAAGYTASKGAVSAMTKTIALDVAKKGIVANCIAPGCWSTHVVHLFVMLTCW
jgi:NAD(P)-dependent dehydrogenase (short-subunit alcohol dehydrogenase family)